MADFAPPSGPPPPKVPEGWKAQWNDQYKEWFYVNIYTKTSQWDRPTEPVYPPPAGDPSAPPGPPPYDPNSAKPLVPEKSGLSSNNPFGPGGPGGSSSHADLTEDERLARQLQEEENARAHTPGGTNRGASDSYYGQGGQQGGYGQQGEYGQQSPYGQSQSPGPGYGGEQLPPRPDETSRGKGKGFLGKLLGKAGGSSKPHYGQQYPPQQQYYGGAPPGQYGGGQYGGYPPQQGYYGQPGYGPPQQAGRKPGGGLGMGGAAALGVGGGLLGGALLAEGLDGGDDGGDGGGGDGDYGGGDDGGGGGDFGGDF